MDLYLAAERKLGLRLSKKWWEQPAMDILRIRAGHVAAETVGVDDSGIIGGGGVEGE